MAVRIEVMVFYVAVVCMSAYSVYGFKSWNTNPWLKFKSLPSNSGNSKRVYSGYEHKLANSQSVHPEKISEACDTQCWTNLAVCFQQTCDYGVDFSHQEACAKYCWAELKPCRDRC